MCGILGTMRHGWMRKTKMKRKMRRQSQDLPSPRPKVSSLAFLCSLCACQFWFFVLLCSVLDPPESSLKLGEPAMDFKSNVPTSNLVAKLFPRLKKEEDLPSSSAPQVRQYTVSFKDAQVAEFIVNSSSGFWIFEMKKFKIVQIWNWKPISHK